MGTFDPKGFWYLGSIGLIVGFVQMLKPWIKDTRWYPVLSLGFGIFFNLGIGQLINQPWLLSIVAGAIASFTASGLFSVTTTYSMKKPPVATPPVAQIMQDAFMRGIGSPPPTCSCGKSMQLLHDTPSTQLWTCPPTGCGRIFLVDKTGKMEVAGTWYQAETNEKRHDALSG